MPYKKDQVWHRINNQKEFKQAMYFHPLVHVAKIVAN